MMRTTYFALFHSHASYGYLAWEHSAIMQRLFRLKRIAVHIPGNLQYKKDCRKMFKKIKIITMPSLFILECVMHVKINLDPYSEHKDFHDHRTRSCEKLVPITNMLKKSDNSVRFFCTTFYIKLATNLNVRTKSSFKSALIKTLMKHSFYRFHEFLECILTLPAYLHFRHTLLYTNFVHNFSDL